MERSAETLILLLLMLGSCRTVPEPAVPDVPVQIITVHDTTVIVRHDSITLIPVEQSSAVLPSDSSHLETSLAVSDAWTDTLGLLHHTIRNKTGWQKQSSSESVTAARDSTASTPVPYPVYVEVPAELKPVQTFFIGLGKLSALALLMLAAWAAYRMFSRHS